ncbi:MAG TPA: ribonuclease III [Chthoniobacterales bacterium]|nr:ribonuclease III [Chthoniobacterales bacterium]
MNPLEQRTGYKFRNSLLLAEALTHPSLGHETQRHHFDNQRLEFLGDAILQLIFTEHLYRLFPHFSEGQLTKLRSRLVSREGLKVHAINIGLGTYLMMGRGEEASGGRQRASILADAFEALVGAIYLDSNLEVVRRFVLEEAQSDIQRLTQQPLEVNPKGQLQEILQAISPKSPIYEIVSQTGPEHQKKFVAKVVWDGFELGSGEGSSKKQAETAAALAALKAKKWEFTPAHQDPQPAEDAPAPDPESQEPATKRAVRKRRKKETDASASV